MVEVRQCTDLLRCHGGANLAREHRKLAAILAADVVGYSRLMGRDESGTLARLRDHRRKCLEPTITRYGGRLVKLTGDGALIDFASAVDALSAAIEFQQAVADANQARPEVERVVFRVGLHLGDLIVEDDDLYGDGVNVAARLETEASPGGITISRNVHEAVAGRLKAVFHDRGDLLLKNIDRPIRAFSVSWDASDWQPPPSPRLSVPCEAQESLPFVPINSPDRPSIAVLPFQNISGDPDQEYFADGMVEDVTTALSLFKSLFVIARNSSFTYKNRAIDIKQVGRELGVRYVLEGSVRKVANRVRITGQLIQASTGTHIWAGRFDGDLTEVFTLQDEVVLSVAGAVVSRLEATEIERARRKPTAALDAYDFYLRGMARVYQLSRESVDEALNLLRRAIELDPEFAPAHAMSAWCYYWRKVNGWVIDAKYETAEVNRLVNKVGEFGKDDAGALSHAALPLGHVAREVDAGLVLAKRAITLNPNLAAAWYASGSLEVLSGDSDVAIAHLTRAMRLSPLDPLSFVTLSYTALAHFFAGRYEQAWPLAERASREQPNFLTALRIAAASNVFAGRPDEARNFNARALQLDPDLRISNLSERIAPLPPDRFAKFANALSAAGLPE